jgi:hypothetical protein
VPGDSVQDVESGAAVDAADEVTAELAGVLVRFTALATGPDDGGDVAADADRIDRIALLEQIKSAVAAAQHTQMVRFARSQVDAHIDDDTLDPKSVGRGIADQIALACRVSPFTGSRRLGVARALHFELPRIRALLAAGRIRWRAGRRRSRTRQPSITTPGRPRAWTSQPRR